MNDEEFLKEIAKLWIELGGDSEGVRWMWVKLQQFVEAMESEIS